MLLFRIPISIMPFGILAVSSMVLSRRMPRIWVRSIISIAVLKSFGEMQTFGMSLFGGVALLSDIAGGPGSALAWAPVFLVGMAIGRLDLHKAGTVIKFIAAGASILVPVKLVEIFVLPGIYQSYMEWALLNPAIVNAEIDAFAMWSYNIQPIMWHKLFISMPQGGSACELLAGTGGSPILLGIFCLVEKAYGRFLKPFCNVGKLSLTLYVIQIVAGWGLQIAGIDRSLMDIGAIPCGNVMVAIFVILLGCIFMQFKSGPFETMMRKFEKKFI